MTTSVKIADAKLIASMKKNPLTDLSYFEFRTTTADGSVEYTGLWPSTKTVCGSLPTKATKFAFNLPMPTIADLRQSLNALKIQKIPFGDIYWFLPKGDVDAAGVHYSAANIIRWMGGLYYDIETAVVSGNHVRCALKSREDPTFEKTVYRTSTSLPQEAIDGIVVGVVKGKNGHPASFRPVLGRRAANPPTFVHFDDGSTASVQNKDGYILFGEQLLAEKKKEINQTYTKFLAHGKAYMEISEQSASEALRAAAEEGGFNFTGNVRAFMLKKDDAPGRDIRYSTYTDPDSGIEFSYPRDSCSWSVLLLVPAIRNCDLPEPEDGGLYGECQKGKVVTELVARSEFRVGGRFDPVFPAHSRQMVGALDAANEIMKSEL